MDQFVFFSPECFVRFCNGRVSSFPMKGTIDASVRNAAEVILSDDKEHAEHLTIVDLIRNDLSKSVGNSRVDRFRYIDKIKTSNKNLLQVSSEISATLPDDYFEKLGSIIFAMLPAGSVSGAPKDRTLEIIRNAETGKRGYYTGVTGVFDGENLESSVNIRFIERNGSGYLFRSGGGITIYSKCENEYMEMLDKIYVPID